MSLLFRAEIVKPLLAWLVSLAVAVVLAAFAVIYSGIFNVAATVEDAAPLRWILITAREASIKSHARAIQAPALDGAAPAEHGFRLFRQECAMCHTPPGRSATIMAKGLNPQAPPLAELVGMTDAELFWVTKYGIRFTGMPAWGLSENDQNIWDVVAFLRTIVNMKAADYNALDGRISPEPLQR